jgi:hypothetical protein
MVSPPKKSIRFQIDLKQGYIRTFFLFCQEDLANGDSATSPIWREIAIKGIGEGWDGMSGHFGKNRS